MASDTDALQPRRTKAGETPIRAAAALAEERLQRNSGILPDTPNTLPSLSVRASRMLARQTARMAVLQSYLSAKNSTGSC
jgi:hypothetical protein